MLLPLPPPTGGTKDEDHELREEPFAAVKNSNEIRKLFVTSTILMTEGLRKEIIIMGKNHPSPLHQ